MSDQETKRYDKRIGDTNNHFSVSSYGWDVEVSLFQGMQTKNRVYLSAEMSPEDARELGHALIEAGNFAAAARQDRAKEDAA